MDISLLSVINLVMYEKSTVFFNISSKNVNASPTVVKFLAFFLSLAERRTIGYRYIWDYQIAFN